VFQFAECPTAGVFHTRPVVLDGLAMDMNISGPFLQKHAIDQLHSEGVLRTKQGKIPLRTQPAVGAPRGVHVAATMIIPAGGMVDVKRPRPLASPSDGQRVCYIDTDLPSRWPGLLGAVSMDGRQLKLVNPTRQDVAIMGGSRIGTEVTPKDEENEDAALWRPPQTVAAPDEFETPATPEWVEEAFREELRCPDSALKTESERRRAICLLKEFADIFSHDGSFGRTGLVRHAIHTGAAMPIKCRNRPVNPALVDNLRTQMEEWLKHGVIEPSTSPWSSALVAVKKKNGKTRWCVDYRALNGVTIKDAYPMPLIEDNLARLAHSTIFSTVDGSGAFHVVELEDEAKPKTAFTTPWGLWQFKRMPFGLTNAPATYSRLMQIALRGIPGGVALSYLDDTLIHAAGYEEHLQHLKTVLEAHRKAGLRLQPAKCHLFRQKVEYLGHLVTGQGVRPTPDYTEVVKKWPVPTTLTETRAFLGKVGYYRRFIKDFGKIARPLTDATKEENLTDPRAKTIKVTEAVKEAHRTLRDALCKAPILAYPRFDQVSTFIVDTDWSHDHRAIGGVLSQRQDGQERVICYGAKKLSVSQANYPATKGELFAVIHFLRHWRYYLQWKRFILRTDHKALVWIRNMEAPDGMVARWLDTLANYDFEVQYRKGCSHGNADGLSRAPLGPADELADDQEDEAEERIMALSDPILHEGRCLPRTMPEWAVEQRKDPLLRKVITYIKEARVPLGEDRRRMDPRLRYFIDLLPSMLLDEHGALCMQPPRTVKGNPNCVPVVPRHLEDSVARVAHTLAGHRGVQATFQMASLQTFLPEGRAVIYRTVQRCLPCQAKAGPPTPQRHTYATVVSGYPFQRISIDFVGPLPRTQRGNTMLLTVKDPFSKWVEAYPLARATAEATAIKLETEIFARFGYPEEVHSDQGTQFVSDIVKGVHQLLGIRTTTTPVYHPQSNPVERAHRDLKAGIRAALLAVGGQEWDRCLGQVLFAFRTTPARGTALSPFQLLFGRHPNIPLGAVMPPPLGSKEVVPYVTGLRDRIEKIQQWARCNLAKEVMRQQKAYKAKGVQFEEGDRVWMCRPRGQLAEGKFERPWSGPWTIEKILSPVLYEIGADGCPNKIIPVDRLKHYYEPEATNQFSLPKEITIDEDADWGTSLLERPGRDRGERGVERRLPSPVSESESSSEESAASESETDYGGQRRDQRAPPPCTRGRGRGRRRGTASGMVAGDPSGQRQEIRGRPPRSPRGRTGTSTGQTRHSSLDRPRQTDGFQPDYPSVEYHPIDEQRIRRKSERDPSRYAMESRSRPVVRREANVVSRRSDAPRNLRRPKTAPSGMEQVAPSSFRPSTDRITRREHPKAPGQPATPPSDVAPTTFAAQPAAALPTRGHPPGKDRTAAAASGPEGTRRPARSAAKRAMRRVAEYARWATGKDPLGLDFDMALPPVEESDPEEEM